MKNKIIFLVFLITLFLGVIIKINLPRPIKPELVCNYFTRDLFDKNILKATTYETKSKPVSAVVPHNEVIMDMAASVLKTLSSYKYDTVILLAPNHKALIGKILISGKSWDTTIGIVEGDEELKEEICKSIDSKIIEEEIVVQEDHSASIIIPYIKYYMPKTKVVTILLNKETTINDIYGLAKTIEEVSENKNVLLLGSIDFAHYQDYDTTVFQDKKTLDFIENKEIEQLKTLHGENLDTSEAMGTIILYSEAKGSKGLKLLEERIVSNMPKTDDYGSYMTFIAEGV